MTEQLQKDTVDIMFARAKFLEILNLGQTVVGTNGFGKNRVPAVSVSDTEQVYRFRVTGHGSGIPFPCQF